MATVRVMETAQEAPRITRIPWIPARMAVLARTSGHSSARPRLGGVFLFLVPEVVSRVRWTGEILRWCTYNNSCSASLLALLPVGVCMIGARFWWGRRNLIVMTIVAELVSASGLPQCEPNVGVWFTRLSFQALKPKSRARRGFEGGGPTRTRTVDQRIMSCLETLQAQ